MDPSAKYWLYFRIRGYRKDRPVKFVLRNANHLRKYLGQTRIRPYMVCREEAEEHWQPLSSPIDLSVPLKTCSSRKMGSCREYSPTNHKRIRKRGSPIYPPTICTEKRWALLLQRNRPNVDRATSPCTIRMGMTISCVSRKESGRGRRTKILLPILTKRPSPTRSREGRFHY